MNTDTFKFMEEWYGAEEVEPMEFYRALFGEGYLSESAESAEYAVHGTILNRNASGKREHIKVWSDLSAIKSVLGEDHREAYIAPVAYVGFRRTNKNARYCFAIAVDLDHLTSGAMPNLFHWIDHLERIPRPTYIVCSGNGLHLYYQFKNPVPCYDYNQSKLKRYRAALTKLVWNAYVSKKYDNPEYETLFQPMRVVGSGTKEGAIVRAYETGEKVTAEYLDKFVPPGNRIGSFEGNDTMPLAYYKILYPEWYERRVINNEPRGYWVCNRAVYDNWLNRIRAEAVVNHRYFAVMALAIYAKKSGVSYKELERDAYSLYPLFESLTVDEWNHFSKDDIASALRAYDSNYITFPRQWIERLTAISIPPNKRNGKTRAAHLAEARAIRDARQNLKGTKWNGRKSKELVVSEWRAIHPDGRKSDCIRDTGLSKKTVYKHWDALQENADLLKESQVTFESAEAAIEYMRKLTPEKAGEFYKNNKAVIDNLIVNDLAEAQARLEGRKEDLKSARAAAEKKNNE